MNSVSLIGRLTRDSELRENEKGTKVSSFTLAIARDENTTDFINCTCFNKVAEVLNKYTKKGSQVGVIGRIQTRTYEEDDKKRTTTYVLVNKLMLLGKKEGTGETNKGFEGNSIKQDEIVLTEDDLPF